MSKARQLIKDLKSSMPTFGGTDPTNILHFYFMFVKECDFEQILKGQACLTFHSFLSRIGLDSFLTAKNGFIYNRLRYWLEYINYFLSMYATASAIQNEVTWFKDLKKVPCESKIELSS